MRSVTMVRKRPAFPSVEMLGRREWGRAAPLHPQRQASIISAWLQEGAPCHMAERWAGWGPLLEES